MGAPVRESWASTASVNGTSISVNVASGIEAGDFLLIIVSNDSSSDSNSMSITDTDWTKIGETGDSVSDCHCAMFWKEADGDETNETVNTGFTVDSVGWYLRFSSVDMSDPIVASNGSEGVTDSLVMPSLSTVVDDYGVAGTAWDGGDLRPFSVSGTGWSQLDEQGINDSATVGGQVSTHDAPGSAGPTVDTDGGTDGYAYIRINIRPSGLDVDNVSGALAGDIVQISDVDVGDIVKISGAAV